MTAITAGTSLYNYTNPGIDFNNADNIRDFKFNIEKVKNHFIITVGCVTLVVHDFKEAKLELTKLFTKELKDFFNETNTST